MLVGEGPKDHTLPTKRQLKATSGLNPFLKEFGRKTTFKAEATEVQEKASGAATNNAFGVTRLSKTTSPSRGIFQSFCSPATMTAELTHL